MIIREATTRDASGIARVAVETWRATYSGIVPSEFLDSLSVETAEKRWQYRMSDPASLWPGWVYFVVEHPSDGVVGFAAGGPHPDNGLSFAAELAMVDLLQSYQHQGLGRRLVQSVATELRRRGHKSMLVWVLQANPHRSFYERLNGHVVGERQVNIGGTTLTEVAYGWRDLKDLSFAMKK